SPSPPPSPLPFAHRRHGPLLAAAGYADFAQTADRPFRLHDVRAAARTGAAGHTPSASSSSSSSIGRITDRRSIPSQIGGISGAWLGHRSTQAQNSWTFRN